MSISIYPSLSFHQSVQLVSQFLLSTSCADKKFKLNIFNKLCNLIVIVICLTLHFPLRIVYNFFYLIILTIKSHMLAHTHPHAHVSHTCSHTDRIIFWIAKWSSVWLSDRLTVTPHAHTARCFQLLNTKPFVWLSNCLPLCLPACLSVCLPACLSVCSSGCLSVCFLAIPQHTPELFGFPMV